MSVGAIARRYRLDGVVATIDLTSAEATLDAQPEAVKQAAMADCLLLTKRDLVDAEQAAALSSIRTAPQHRSKNRYWSS